MNGTSWAQLQEALNDLDFPADKDEIVRHAQDHGDWEAVLVLKALPVETYSNMAQLRASVRLDPAAEDGQTPSIKAGQARTHHSRQIAEHLREADQ